MKYKILSAVVATALLNGCGGTDPSTTVQAFDPAIANMVTSYKCTDESGAVTSESIDAGSTDGYGNVVISDSTFALNTETCELTFEDNGEAVDVSNNKPMSGLTLKVPRGMAENGQKLTGSPASTLLFDLLAENEADYTDSDASDLLEDLGLGALLANGADIKELLLNPEAAAKKLSVEDKSKLLATLAIAADVVKNPGTTTITERIAATKAISAETLTSYPYYPKASADGTGDAEIYLTIPASTVSTVAADPTAEVTLPDAEEAEPLDPETLEPTDATGGTGGTGATGGTGGTGV